MLRIIDGRGAAVATSQRVPVQNLSGPVAGAWLRAVIGFVARCAERRRQRQVLGELDDRLLKDIGITRAQARFEADKPFWLP